MSKFAKGDSAAAGMGVNNANKIKDKTTEAVSNSSADESYSPHPTLPIGKKYSNPYDEEFKEQYGMYPYQVGANDVFNKTMDMYNEDRHELNDYPLTENSKPVVNELVPIYKVVTGSGQSKRYKTFTADGTQVKEGRGSGPANLPEGPLGESQSDTIVEDEIYDDQILRVARQPRSTTEESDDEVVVPTTEYKDFFQRNILHDYDAVTYNFRLSMLSMRDAISAQEHIIGTNFDTNKGFSAWTPQDTKMIIAETGSTVLTINEVSINATAGPVNNGKRLTGAVNFQMTIQQPLNASFTDVLVNSAISLGLPDGLKATYLLELTFKGRDPKTGEIINSIPSTERQFLIEIISVEANVDTNGSTYNVRAVRAGDKGMKERTYTMDRPLQLSNLKTVNNLISAVAETVNLNELDKLAVEKGVLDEYYIHLDNYTKQMIGEDEIIDTASLETVSTNLSDNENDDSQYLMFRIPARTSLDRVLEFGLSHSKKLQKLAKGMDTGTSVDADSSNSEDITNFVKHIFHIKIDTKNIAWDTLRNDYAREYHYTISLFPTIRPEISPGIWNNATEVQKQKIQALVNGDLSQSVSRKYKALSKRYDYLFTGLNDKVLRFDIKYNNQFFFALHSYQGIYSKLDKTTKEKVVKSADTLLKFKEQQQVLKDAWATYLSQKAENLTIASSEERERANQEAYIASQFEAEREKLINLYVEGVKDGTFEGDAATAQSLQSIGSGPFASTKESLSTYAMAQPYEQEGSSGMNPGQVKLYAETLDRETVIEQLNTSDKPFQIMWGATPDEFRNKFNADSETPGKGHFDSVIEASLSDFEADLVAMDMDIKGDPFWLESERDPKFIRSASYHEGENYILFRAITSAGEPDPETGLANPNREGKEQMLNGVYAVVQIMNNFTGGQFTQNLKGVKEAFITDISILEQYQEEMPYTSIVETEE